MKINDNGFEMKDKELWWVGIIDEPWSANRRAKIVMGVVQGDRPYQQMYTVGGTASECWVLKRVEGMPEPMLVEIDDERFVAEVPSQAYLDAEKFPFGGRMTKLERKNGLWTAKAVLEPKVEEGTYIPDSSKGS